MKLRKVVVGGKFRNEYGNDLASSQNLKSQNLSSQSLTRVISWLDMRASRSAPL